MAETCAMERPGRQLMANVSTAFGLLGRKQARKRHVFVFFGGESPNFWKLLEHTTNQISSNLAMCAERFQKGREPTSFTNSSNRPFEAHLHFPLTNHKGHLLHQLSKRPTGGDFSHKAGAKRKALSVCCQSAG